VRGSGVQRLAVSVRRVGKASTVRCSAQLRGTTTITRESRGEKSREALAESPELQSTMRQAIFASGPVRPGLRDAAA